MLPPKPEPKPRVELCGMRGDMERPDRVSGGMMRAETVEETGFAPEDYAFTAKLLRQHTVDARYDLFRKVCSYNLAIILAALDAMADEP